MHFILDNLKKLARNVRIRIVVDARSIDIEHFAPKEFFRRADILDAGEQFVKVVAPAHLLEPFVIQRKAFDDVFAQTLASPNPELCTPKRFYPVSDRNNHIQVIKIDFSGNLPGSFGLNYPEFPDSFIRREFAFLVNILDMFVYGSNILLKQFRHHLLRQPYSFIFKSNLDASKAVFGFINENFGLWLVLRVDH